MMLSRLDEESNAQNQNSQNNSSGESSDFFSPISLAFFGRDVLPRSHDTSWIGARQSPIPSFDREEEEEEENVAVDEEANRVTEKYHRALHESLEAAEFVNERTGLLHHRRRRNSHKMLSTRTRPIHPLWDGATPEERRLRQRGCCQRVMWGDVLIGIVTLHLLATTAYEAYLWQSTDNVGVVLTWMSILGPRSAQTLILAGALDAERVLLSNEYWRLLSSLFVCPSLLEWLLILVGWNLVYHNGRRYESSWSWYAWFGTWFGSAFVGQLWMVAWDLRVRPTVGCCLWGTGGVLTSVGIHRPDERWRHFFICKLAVILSWWEQPCNSVLGVMGATFFGWALASATARGSQTLGEKDQHASWASYLCVGITLTIVLLPVLSIALWGTSAALYYS